jgi:hypothetical protein
MVTRYADDRPTNLKSQWRYLGLLLSVRTGLMRDFVRGVAVPSFKLATRAEKAINRH